MSNTSPETFSREEEMYDTWRTIAQPGKRFACRDGIGFTILSPGRRNLEDGPDFLEAVLLIDGELSIGAVEMHRREGEWFSHRHHLDPAYDEVILHVVGSDAPVRGRRTDIPTFLLEESGTAPDQDVADPAERFEELFSLLAALSWDRFFRRVARFREEFVDPQERLLIPIFDGLGFSRNRTPMKRVATELLARGFGSDPREVLTRTLDAARLPRGRDEQMRKRFGLTSLSPTTSSTESRDWDFRVRPGNRPEVRLVAGAVLIDRLFLREGLRELRDTISSNSLATLQRRLLVRASGFSFLGSGRIDTMIIDVFLPYFAAFAIETGDQELLATACHLYRHYPTLVPNVRLREFSRRFADGRGIRGGFLQQGALEYIATTGKR